MTETTKKNNEIYLKLLKENWDLDDESLKYVEHRLSDEWEPVPELKELIGLPGSKYEDQRIRFDMDMTSSGTLDFFKNDDESYRLFKNFFSNAIEYLENYKDCHIGYSEFIANKVIYKKNTMKIKKVFELVYESSPSLFEGDFDCSYSKERCAKEIVRRYEQIGASKKSAKNLQFVISFNPVDWFLASTGEDFSSCFNLDNQCGGYQYCLGLPFLCGDRNRIMIYITNGKQKDFMGIKVDSVQTRTWCILDKSDRKCIVKWYPNDVIGVEPVKKITGCDTFCSSREFSEGKYPLDIISTKAGAVINVYSDMGKWVEKDGKIIHVGNSKDGQQVFTKNAIDVHKTGSNSSFIFNFPNSSLGLLPHGYRIKEWADKGFHIDLMFAKHVCSCCGDSDKGGFVIKGKFICYKCYKDKVYVCKNCGDSHFISKDGKNDPVIVETTDGDMVKLCPKCASKKEEHICSCCGKYHIGYLVTTKNEKLVCHSCLAKKYVKCNFCNSYEKIENVSSLVNTLTGEVKYICGDCLGEKRKNLYRQPATDIVYGRKYEIKLVKPGVIVET